jgi:hypothetical protein
MVSVVRAGGDEGVIVGMKGVVCVERGAGVVGIGRGAAAVIGKTTLVGGAQASKPDSQKSAAHKPTFADMGRRLTHMRPM